MPYKDGAWGAKAKVRSKNRAKYFSEYNQKRDAKKVAARNAVYYAVKSKALKKLPCERKSLSCQGRIEADHTDYSQPLKVTWLCSFHHREAENERRDLLSKKVCTNCGCKIYSPKIKYCSDKCGQFGWKKERRLN